MANGRSLDTGVELVVSGEHGAPFDVLGPHVDDAGVTVRAFVPGARAMTLVRGASRTPMTRVHAAGVYEARVEGAKRAFAYRLEIELATGLVVERDDPYRFKPVLSEFDLHLLAEGTHYDVADRLGAHVLTHQKVDGVAFAVWAPSATRVSVIGGFNGWDGTAHPMRQRETGGVWELFVPGLAPGAVYKYEIRSRFEERTLVKADPCSAFMELRPNNASIVVGPSNYEWGDDAWMQSRAARHALDRPLAIYEVHAASWRRDVSDPARSEEGQEGRILSWRELAETLVPYAAEMGFTHIELLPVTEHPYDGSWGYQSGIL